MLLWVGLSPSPVHVVSRNAATVVSVDDSIGAQHGHYLENKFAAEFARFLLVAEQEVNATLHHP